MCSLSLPVEDTVTTQPSVCQEENPHQELHPAGPDLALSRTVRNKFLLVKPRSLWYSVLIT